MARASSHPLAFPSGVPLSACPTPRVPEALPDRCSPWPCLQFPPRSPTGEALESHAGSMWGLEPQRQAFSASSSPVRAGQDLQGQCRPPDSPRALRPDG